jgi:Flp pilus assembly pilin Flp
MIEVIAVLKSRVRALPPRFLDIEEGQTMIEYALLTALISIVAIAMMLLVGPYLNNLFKDVINSLNAM